MARRRALARFADTYLHHHLATKQMEEQERLIGERQMEIAKFNHQANTEDKLSTAALGDPTGRIIERLIKGGRSTLGGMDLKPLAPTRERAAGTVSTDIDSANNLGELPTLGGIARGYAATPGASNAAPGGINTPGADGLAPTPAPTAIEDLMAQRQQKMADLKAGAPPVNKTFMDQGVESSVSVNPWEDQGTVRPTERTGIEEGQRQGAIDQAAAPGAAIKAGAEAGARSQAEFPWQLKLAKTRADYALLNQKGMEDYKASHPKASQQEVNRASTATTAVGYSQEVRLMLDEMEKRGMLGPLSGRAYDIFQGKVKAEALFQNPDDAKLAANFFSSMKLLSSLAAVAHGGSRGGGSIQMVKQFESILNGIGDKSIITGQLDSLERLMEHYRTNPAEPYVIENPSLQGGPPTAPQDPLSRAREKAQRMIKGGL